MSRELGRVALVLCCGAVAGLLIETSALGLVMMRCAHTSTAPSTAFCQEAREVVREAERGASAVMLAAFGFLGWKAGRAGEEKD